MRVIIDTNIWLSELALKSAVGSAVRHFLRSNDATIVVPEVVRMETETNLRKKLRDAREQVEKGHRELLAIFGQLKAIAMPSNEQIEEIIQSLFHNIGTEHLEVPFTLDHARSSLLRTINKTAPSEGSQQFKDGVIWQVCLEQLKHEDVLFVTNDKAFYEQRNYNKGLCRQLLRETQKYSNKLKIYPTLANFLPVIERDIKIDPIALEFAYIQEHEDRVLDMAMRNQLELTGKSEVQTDIFVTEDPAKLYLSFAIKFECQHEDEEGVPVGTLTAFGVATYDTTTKSFLNIGSRGEKLIFKLPDGSEGTQENVVALVGGISLGHRTVRHEIRHRVTQENSTSDNGTVVPFERER